MKGYQGKILIVNLTTGDIETQKIDDSVYENFLSGVGLGAYYLYQNIPTGADPLGPDNILGFVSGLLTGTGSFMTGRWMAVCKSPLTGGWGDANCGGTFSPAIKQCGVDAIFFKGSSEKPVYLYMDNKGAQLRDASALWGKDAIMTEEILEKENWIKKKPVIATIGQAAEKLSLISGIVNDRGRIAARSGVGAVMGSKKLKAVVLAGSKPIKCNDPEAVKAISIQFAEKVRHTNFPSFVGSNMLALIGKQVGKAKEVKPNDPMLMASLWKKWGTGFGNTYSATSGDSPIKNWGGSCKEYNRSYYKKVTADKVNKNEMRKYHCYSCAIGCGGICDIKSNTKGEFKHTHKPEYETVCAFSGLVMNKDLDAIYYINELMNRAGMDTISGGSAVAYAIECYENGIITKVDTGGLELTWGNAEAIVALIKKMIQREGIGDVLADGVKRATQRIGQGSECFAIHAGGQEPGMHDSRFDPMTGVHYSADPTPGRHTIGAAVYYNAMSLWDKVSWAPKVTKYLKDEEYVPSDEEALKSVAGSCYKQLTDGVGGCLFGMILGVHHWKMFEWLNAATGWNKTPDEYMEMGKRMQTLRQLFNIKHGINPMDFKLHNRMAGKPPLEEGPLTGRQVPIEEMMMLHWKNFGWDEETGRPLESTVETLDLQEIV
ncbi:aldehyde ferredoxin oxidoreductase family protein [Vallitalea okinawensis]|uniref:aldehyde ferredoxin oxidoreductase family protein n=1 Tax=Vallitalea okinawensis TaxID=2078660 RepID=UPI0014782158|nr:aldehyde ferredoxin oxidoreductase family protein [Vallitalea okinawensis]